MMPLYEFYCATCGPFEHWRALNEASEMMLCPLCQTAARRIYTTPNLVKTPPALARMRNRAEKSAYEPEVIRREPAAPAEEPPTPVIHQSHGRPWLIGH